jgi:hypothetical protein
MDVLRPRLRTDQGVAPRQRVTQAEHELGGMERALPSEERTALIGRTMFRGDV